MVRLVIGSILGGLAQFVVGFIFWGTPLSRIAFAVAPDAQNAALQRALALNLTPTGTGTYHIPWPDTASGTTLHGQGPVALVHFNSAGFPLMDSGALIGGLILSIVATFLIGLALYWITPRVTDFATRAKIVVAVTIATVLYFTIGEPVFNSYLPWTYFIYLAVAEAVGLVVAGLIVARWFLPGPARSAADGVTA